MSKCTCPPGWKHLPSCLEVSDRVEMLTGELVGGVVHARYPSGLAMLCGLDSSGVLVDRGPDCVGCRLTAARFDGIDGSAPAAWKDAA